MSSIQLMPHQLDVLNQTEKYNRVAYYLDMGLGKTFVGSEKLDYIGNNTNLVVCQKSKVRDWVEHFQTYYDDYTVYDLTVKGQIGKFLEDQTKKVGIVNYDIIFRRKSLQDLTGTLMLDESSYIKNEQAKRSKGILSMKPDAVILLSGTPTGGKYEELWSQCHLLGWNISKDTFLNTYTKYKFENVAGFKRREIYGYKNVDRLKRKLHDHGAVFMKTDEVISLPEQNFNIVKVPKREDYDLFYKTGYVMMHDQGPLVKIYEGCNEIEYERQTELIGDTKLTRLLYSRQLCGHYNKDKLKAFEDLVNSTNDRLVVFYNFTAELDAMLEIIDRPYSVINGATKNLASYEACDNSITFVQYQSGAMGLNLQKANKIIYFTLPLSSELYEQSKKRIHRVGQNKPCFYYLLLCPGTVEMDIKRTLDQRRDYTDELFIPEGL